MEFVVPPRPFHGTAFASYLSMLFQGSYYTSSRQDVNPSAQYETYMPTQQQHQNDLGSLPSQSNPSSHFTMPLGSQPESVMLLNASSSSASGAHLTGSSRLAINPGTGAINRGSDAPDAAGSHETSSQSGGLDQQQGHLLFSRGSGALLGRNSPNQTAPPSMEVSSSDQVDQNTYPRQPSSGSAHDLRSTAHAAPQQFKFDSTSGNISSASPQHLPPSDPPTALYASNMSFAAQTDQASTQAYASAPESGGHNLTTALQQNSSTSHSHNPYDFSQPYYSTSHQHRPQSYHYATTSETSSSAGRQHPTPGGNRPLPLCGDEGYYLMGSSNQPPSNDAFLAKQNHRDATYPMQGDPACDQNAFYYAPFGSYMMPANGQTALISQHPNGVATTSPPGQPMGNLVPSYGNGAAQTNAPAPASLGKMTMPTSNGFTPNLIGSTSKPLQGLNATPTSNPGFSGLVPMSVSQQECSGRVPGTLASKSGGGAGLTSANTDRDGQPLSDPAALPDSVASAPSSRAVPKDMNSTATVSAHQQNLTSHDPSSEGLNDPLIGMNLGSSGGMVKPNYGYYTNAQQKSISYASAYQNSSQNYHFTAPKASSVNSSPSSSNPNASSLPPKLGSSSSTTTSTSYIPPNCYHASGASSGPGSTAQSDPMNHSMNHLGGLNDQVSMHSAPMNVGSTPAMPSQFPSNTNAIAAPVRRPRGRPRKYPTSQQYTSSSSTTTSHQASAYAAAAQAAAVTTLAQLGTYEDDLAYRKKHQLDRTQYGAFVLKRLRRLADAYMELLDQHYPEDFNSEEVIEDNYAVGGPFSKLATAITLHVYGEPHLCQKYVDETLGVPAPAYAQPAGLQGAKTLNPEYGAALTVDDDNCITFKSLISTDEDTASDVVNDNQEFGDAGFTEEQQGRYYNDMDPSYLQQYASDAQKEGFNPDEDQYPMYDCDKYAGDLGSESLRTVLRYLTLQYKSKTLSSTSRLISVKEALEACHQRQSDITYSHSAHVVNLNATFMWSAFNPKIPVRDLALSRSHIAALLNDNRVFVYRHFTHPLVKTLVNQWEHLSVFDEYNTVAIRIASGCLPHDWREEFHKMHRQRLIDYLRQALRTEYNCSQPFFLNKTYRLSDEELKFAVANHPDGLLCCENVDPEWLPDPFVVAMLDQYGSVYYTECCGYYNYPSLTRVATDDSQEGKPTDTEFAAPQGFKAAITTPKSLKITGLTKQEVTGFATECAGGDKDASDHLQVHDIVLAELTENALYFAEEASEHEVPQLPEDGSPKAAGASEEEPGYEHPPLSEPSANDIPDGEKPHPKSDSASVSTPKKFTLKYDISLAMYAAHQDGNQHCVYVKGKNFYICFRNFPTGPAKLHCSPLGYTGALLLANGTLWSWSALPASESSNGSLTAQIHQVGGSLAGRRVIDLAGVGADFMALTSDGVVHEWNNYAPYLDLADQLKDPALSIPQMLTRPIISEPVELTPEFQTSLLMCRRALQPDYRQGQFKWSYDGLCKDFSADAAPMTSPCGLYPNPNSCGDLFPNSPHTGAAGFGHEQQHGCPPNALSNMQFSHGPQDPHLAPDLSSKTLGGGVSDHSKLLMPPETSSSATTAERETPSGYTGYAADQSGFAPSYTGVDDDYGTESKLKQEEAAAEEEKGRSLAFESQLEAQRVEEIRKLYGGQDLVERIFVTEGATLFIRRPQGRLTYFSNTLGDYVGTNCHPRWSRLGATDHYKVTVQDLQHLTRKLGNQFGDKPLPANPVIIARLRLSDDPCQMASDDQNPLQNELTRMADSTPAPYRILTSPVSLIVSRLKRVRLADILHQRKQMETQLPLAVAAYNPAMYLEAFTNVTPACLASAHLFSSNSTHYHHNHQQHRVQHPSISLSPFGAYYQPPRGGHSADHQMDGPSKTPSCLSKAGTQTTLNYIRASDELTLQPEQDVESASKSQAEAEGKQTFSSIGAVKETGGSTIAPSNGVHNEDAIRPTSESTGPKYHAVSHESVPALGEPHKEICTDTKAEVLSRDDGSGHQDGQDQVKQEPKVVVGHPPRDIAHPSSLSSTVQENESFSAEAPMPAPVGCDSASNSKAENDDNPNPNLESSQDTGSAPGGGKGGSGPQECLNSHKRHRRHSSALDEHQYITGFTADSDDSEETWEQLLNTFDDEKVYKKKKLCKKKKKSACRMNFAKADP